MAYYLRKRDGIEPVIRTTDILEIAPGLHNDIPSFLGFSYWVHTTGGVLAAASAYALDIAYVDKVGVERVISGTPISLVNGEALFNSPVQIVERLSDVSAFEIRENLIGLTADGALISYRIFFSNPNGEEAYIFDADPA